MVQAHYDCRQHKRNTASALAFELHLERNLVELYERLMDGSYRPGRSISFVITHPKYRHVCAADYPDRVVHHVLYNHIAPGFHKRFVADSCACIPGRGTLYGAKRLEGHIRSATENWSKPAWALKLDIKNCFPSLNKHIIFAELQRHIHEPWWLALAALILFHDPLTDCEYRGRPELLDRIPVHKRLGSMGPDRGLAIGNLSSQFLLNVALNLLDQYVKHVLGVRYYVRYVDDSVYVGHSPQWLEAVHHAVGLFLKDRLDLELNESKTVLQPVDRGVDFAGHVSKPWRRTTRRHVVNHAVRCVATVPAKDVLTTTNSYLGLCRQASKSHNDQARICRAAWRRGHKVEGDLSKIHRRKAA